MLWQKKYTLAQLNQLGKNCAVGHLGIEITEIGEDFLIATMPVDNRTTQPFGLLHGGASVLLAETLGSLAAFLSVPEGKGAAGVEINASHLKAVRQGVVRAKVIPIKLGAQIQVWQIDIRDEQDKLCAVCRLTLSIITL